MASPQPENGHTDIANELLDFLCFYRMPGEARQVFDAVIRKTWGWHRKASFISLEEFSRSTGLKKPNVSRALKSLIDHGIINHDNGAYAIIKDYEQWIGYEYHQAGAKTPLSPTIKGPLSATIKPEQLQNDGALSPTIKATIPQEIISHDNETLSATIKVYKESIKKVHSIDIHREILDYWNQRKIIVHRELTKSIQGAISSKLTRYTREEIMGAIDNYAAILQDSGYILSHHWTLTEFLQRSFEKFTDVEVARKNYAKREEQGKDQRDPDKYTRGKYGHMVHR